MTEPTTAEVLANEQAERLMELFKLPAERLGGCWIAYYSDWSGIAVFGTEIEALRHAVEHSMIVQFFQWGEVR